MAKTLTGYIYRSAETGRIVPREYAQANPATTVRERVTIPAGRPETPNTGGGRLRPAPYIMTLEEYKEDCIAKYASGTTPRAQVWKAVKSGKITADSIDELVQKVADAYNELVPPVAKRATKTAKKPAAKPAAKPAKAKKKQQE